MTRPVASQRFRQRKLSTRVPLPVLREKDLVETLDGDAQNTPKVETGVEKNEETEHHLQAAISASHAAAAGGHVSQIYIPTPNASHISGDYQKLYPEVFSQPATYIRFSSTVEDCCGCPYNMTEDDDHVLRELNDNAASSRRHASTQCTDTQFEEVMYFFEETAATQQPFAAVGDPVAVLTWEEMQASFDENIEAPARVWAPDIYPHWHARRVENGNLPLQPGLKLKVIETSNDTDDNDPYVCFRRREVRQARKTRGRDAQSVEKLRRLRRELEDARQLVALIRQREVTKREQLTVDRQLFEQRMSMRKLKRTLPEPFREGDEDLLINQKPQKKRPAPPPPVITTSGAPARISARPDGRPSDTDLVTLASLLAEREREIQREINLKMQQHQKWNENFVDLTTAPLTPPPLDSDDASFRPAITEYLPTPPASISSEQSGDHAMTGADDERPLPAVTVRYVSPPLGDGMGLAPNQPSFRRRIGRGGRMMIDRRGLRPPSSSTQPMSCNARDQAQAASSHDKFTQAMTARDHVDHALMSASARERFRFDHEDDDDDEHDSSTYLISPYETSNMKYRAAITGLHAPHAQAMAARRGQADIAPVQVGQPNMSHVQAVAGVPPGSATVAKMTDST